MVGLPKCKEGKWQQFSFHGYLVDDVAIIESFSWRDERNIFHMGKKHLREMQDQWHSLENANI